MTPAATRTRRLIFPSKRGLARIERAKPIVVQTFDVVVTALGAFTTAAVSPFLHLIPWRQHLQPG
jgi:voltage-gated potassium channel Kch